MKTKSILFLLTILLSSCGVGIESSNSNLANQLISNELRGVWITKDTPIGFDSVRIDQNESTTFKNVADANFNSIFLEVKANGDLPETKYAIDEAHKHELKIYASIDVFSLHKSKSLPTIKTELSKSIKALVENQNIDGIHFGNIERFENDFSIDELNDFIETLVVEAMTIKPYLVNSITISDISSYRKNYIDWLDKGIIDIVLLQIEKNPSTSTAESWLNFHNTTINYKNVYPIIESADSDKLNALRISGCEGFVFTSLNQSSFNEKIESSENMKRTKPEQIIQLNVSNLLSEIRGGEKVKVSDQYYLTDSKGCIGVIVNELPDTLTISVNNTVLRLLTEWWRLPYKYIVNTNNSVSRANSWVEFRNTPPRETNQSNFNFLAKTDSSATAWINDIPAKVYNTGIFFNKVEFSEGSNRVEAKVMASDSSSAIYVREFIYHKADNTTATFPLWINEKTIEPNVDIALLDEDVVRVKFIGSKGQEGSVEVENTDLVIPCMRTDRDNFSIYEAEIPLYKLAKGSKHKIKFVIETNDESINDKMYSIESKATIEVKEIEEFPKVKTKKENSRLTYALGEVRLGGPLRAEYPTGVILTTSGKIGNNYRVKLNKIDNGYIDKSYVEELPSETIKPMYNLSSMYCTPTDSGDVLIIPYLESVPYSVVPQPHLNRILITLYGVETSSTWITHKTNRKIIDRITWEQTTPETYQIYVNLNTAKVWGYDINIVGKSLVFRVKYPPAINKVKELPLSGLKIAIEAGHGGTNLGAIGLSGLKEKDINFALSQKLGEVCKKFGAEVVQVRNSDKNMGLSEKRDISRKSKADIHISIHANSGGSGGGYLGVSGASTYYHNPFWAPLAEKIFNNILEMNIGEFGVVGSFNYTVTRMTEMPSILVEQAFMSNAEDEEKLANEEFRVKMAVKIYAGIIEYLEYMNDK